MKELSIEEKAQRYDEALERARKCLDEKRDTCFVRPDVIFPELAESEDDRIRKSIIEHLQCDVDDMAKSDCPFDFEAEIEELSKYIAWLEKQGKEECALKSFKDEDVRKFMQYIEKEAKAYEFNLPNRGYDIFAFAKDILVWLEKQAPKQEWSDEDEELLQHCCGAIAAADYYTFEDKEEMENWLKSLKQIIGG